jgi:hypothetical protein
MVSGTVPILRTRTWMFYKGNIVGNIPLSTVNNVKLKGTIEDDEFYIKTGMQRKAYDNDVIQRKAQEEERSLKPW